MSELLLDAAGRRRSPATLPEFHAGRPPRNKGMRYPPTTKGQVSGGRRRHARGLRIARMPSPTPGPTTGGCGPDERLNQSSPSQRVYPTA